MIVLPAIDLWNGHVVKLEARAHRSVETVYGEPAAVADRWLSQGATWLHVVDLNASIGEGEPNLRVLGEILPRALRSGAKVQWGGGVREDRTLETLFGRGVERAIVGTKAIEDWAWLQRAAARWPGRIVVSIDGKGREILIRGWQETSGIDAVEFVRRADPLELWGYLYTNVAVEGRGQGVDWGPVREIVAAAARPVVFSGGVTTLEDVTRFKDLGAYGIIAGSALYRGRFGLEDALALAR